jgi:hypothetical protein
MRAICYSIRSLGRKRAFSATIVLLLALGIGANALIFTAVDVLLLRDLPIKKLRDGVGVRGAGVFVADVGGEEFDEPPGGFLTGARNRGREPVKTGTGQLTAGNWNNGEGQTG